MNWFLTGPIPANALSTHYSLGLVAISYVIAVLASYVALDFVGRLRSEENVSLKKYWLIGGAFSMGAGIWSMHFIGMLAFNMPVPMGYSLFWTLASLIVAILASAFALFILKNKNYSVPQLAFGGVIIGLGIATMHYMGMAGMSCIVNIQYIPEIFILSILIAIIASEAALVLALKSNEGSLHRQMNYKFISALIMGIAICGMHYTGMAAAVFTPFDCVTSSYETIQPDLMAFFIAGITTLIITLALTVSTYYRQMVNTARNEKEYLNTMLDNLEDGIIACNSKGEITIFNKPLQKNIYNLKPRMFITDLQDYFTLMRDDNVISYEEFPLKKALAGKIIHSLEYVIQYKNGISRNVVIDGQSIITSLGRKLGAVIVLHDVTELKRNEKLKNEFVSIVSHELRTPLTSIRGALGLLVGGAIAPIPEKALNLLEIANSNCSRLLLLINDILDIEKIEAGKMNFQFKMVDINTLIEEAIKTNVPYAEKFNVKLKLNANIPELKVSVDPDRLLQVLANLLSNAIKFSTKGKEVSINIKKEKNVVRVEVTNQGETIPAEFQSQIFQKFSQVDTTTTRTKGGTGLGLSIIKAIINKLGGNIKFISENGETTFYFELPVFSPHFTPLEHRRLLICEDDPDQAKYLGVLLESAGFVVHTARNAADAKELLLQNNYQALLLDLILPDQDGISLIRELRSNPKTSNLPIIVISVLAKTGKSLLNGDAVSVVDWLEKPLDFNKLLAVIGKIRRSNEKKPNILHIEDDTDTQQILAMLLADNANIVSEKTLQASIKQLKKEKFDLVILDLALPDGNGVEIIPILSKYKIPILVYSASELNQEYAKYVTKALVKGSLNNEGLLKTIMEILEVYA